MTETYLNILTKEEFDNRPIQKFPHDRFIIEKDIAVLNHLGNMFDEHVERTDKIIVGGDCVLTKKDLKVMLELIKAEEEKLKVFYLDSWEFQVRPKVELINYESLKYAENYDSTKVYLAGKVILNSKYEIKSAKVGEYEFVVEKQWCSITKVQIREYLNELKSIFINALEKDLIIISTYY